MEMRKQSLGMKWIICVGSLVGILGSGFAGAAVQMDHYKALYEASKAERSAPARSMMGTHSQVPVRGELESLTLDSSCGTDRWCGGTMTVGGQTIQIPRNLLIDL